MFQSTLPRRERHSSFSKCLWGLAVSIHAPTQGATLRICDVSRSFKFQSTLPRRERQTLMHHMLSTNWFQSTLPRRERLKYAHDVRLVLLVSIHAPTQGATRTATRFIGFKCRFNPRSHAGSDQTPDTSLSYSFGFQSTLPRRERLCAVRWIRQHNCFNPRSHAGSDQGEYDHYLNLK